MPEKHSVFIIGSRGFPGISGGIENHVQALSTRLASNGAWCINVLVPERNYKVSKYLGVNFIPIKTIPTKGIEKFVYAINSALYSLVKRPDLVHVHGLNSAHIIPFLRLARIKTIYTHHSRDYLYPKWGRVSRLVLKANEKFSRVSNKIMGVLEHLTSLIG